MALHILLIVKTWEQARHRWMDKLTVAPPENGIIFSAKKEMNYVAMKRHGEKKLQCILLS